MMAGSYLQRLGLGLAASAAIGVLVTVGCNLAISYAHGWSKLQLWDEFSVSDVLIISAPFALLSLFAISSLSAWTAGIGVTIAFWAFMYLPSAMQTGGGANIGFGILLPFSPIFVFVVAVLGLLPEASRDDR